MSIPFSLSYAALWILVILHSLLLLGVLRLVSRIQPTGALEESNEVGLRSGQIAPRFSAVDLAGNTVGSANFAGHPTALLFVGPKCPSCTATLYEMEALNRKVQGHVVLICSEKRDACAQLGVDHELDIPIVADEDARIYRLFGISSLPTAVILDEGGRVQSYGQPKRGEEIEEMLERARQLEPAEVR